LGSNSIPKNQKKKIKIKVQIQIIPKMEKIKR
jgi:hypothetical protein